MVWGLIFLPLGVGALIAAIEAASLVGVLVELTGITLDVAVIAVNEPETMENNKERAKFVNTLAFFYAFARLPSALDAGISTIKNANSLLVEALGKMKNLGSRSYNWIKNLFRQGSKTEALFRDLFKLMNKNTGLMEGVITDYQFAKLATRLKKELGIDLHMIDASNESYKALFAKWKEKPIYGVFHHKKFKNSRYGLVLDGPAIYIFRGFTQTEEIKATFYTLQHELFHAKLWYAIMVENRLKGGASLYNKIPMWLHEADVIGEFSNANKIKPGKWPEAEMQKDLDNLLLRFGGDVEKAFGKKPTLKDFENWDISKYLLNLVK